MYVVGAKNHLVERQIAPIFNVASHIEYGF